MQVGMQVDDDGESEGVQVHDDGGRVPRGGAGA